MNNQFLQHLGSITPQGRARDTKIFVPVDEIQEGSRSVKRTERLRASRRYIANKSNIDVQSRDRSAIAKERFRSGLDPKIPVSSVQSAIPTKLSWRVKSEPHALNTKGEPVKPGESVYRAAARVPKAVLKFREKGRAKKAAAMQLKEGMTTTGMYGGDPNRGGPGRKKPEVPPGMDPYMYKGKPYRSRGKLHKKLSGLSDSERRRYYMNMGMRSRAASRGGVTQRLYPITEGLTAKIKKTASKAGKIAKILAKKTYKAASGRPDSTDVMITGRTN